MGKALYRKYRARTLSEIKGQEHITAPLANSLKSGKISHAYLFTGPRGTGKTSVARILAHEINQFAYELEDSYTDIIEIDAASNTGVDNIRELRERAAIAPTQGKYKIYIIDEVHMLSKSAFNALLKTLEEPPAHVIFIMATTDPEKVPVTIISRSQQFQFRLSDADTMHRHLSEISHVEKIDIADDAITLIAERGGGSFRDSISLLDQISALTDQKITRETIEHSLGLPSGELVSNLLTAYSQQDPQTIISTLTTLANNNVKPDIIASELIATIAATPDSTTLPLLDKLIEVARSYHPAVKLLVALLQNTLPMPITQPQPTTPKQIPPTPKPTKVAPLKEPSKQPEELEPTPTEPELITPTDPLLSNFSLQWEDIITEVAQKSKLFATQLAPLKHELTDTKLTIHANNKIVEKNLNKKANQDLIRSTLPPTTALEIIPFSTKTSTAKSTPPSTTDPISAIMGVTEEVSIEEVFESHDNDAKE